MYEPFCNTNENCDGIRCQLRIVGSTFYVEIVVLPCENAIDLRVEDGSFAVLHTTRFTQSGLRTIVIRGISLQVNGTIIARDYSLLIGVSVYLIVHFNALRCKKIRNSFMSIRYYGEYHQFSKQMRIAQ